MITLKTLPQATAQEVFDQVTRHLLTQLAPAQNETGSCKYKLEQPRRILKCAAGCLIADDEYKKEFAGKSWNWLVSHGLVPNTHAALIISLQKMHNTYLVRDWPERLRRLATDYGLQYNPPQQS